jgi:hypothetical protein
MEQTQTCAKKCPLGGFCWKSPMHWFFFLAVLPFAVAGTSMVVSMVNNVVAAIAGK